MSASASEQSGLLQTAALWLQYAVSDGIPQRSFTVAAIVGTVLNLINQGDAFLGYAELNWVKLLMTYCVPYLVATYGAVSYKLRLRPDTDEARKRE